MGLVILILAAAVTVAPIAITHITDPLTINIRVSQISIFRDVQQDSLGIDTNIDDIINSFINW
jgi:hypothetical protein